MQSQFSDFGSVDETNASRSAATAAYMADMLSELRAMGQKEDWAMLVYLLEMAIVEAHAINNNGAGNFPKDEQETVLVPDARAQMLAERFLAGELD